MGGAAPNGVPPVAHVPLTPVTAATPPTPCPCPCRPCRPCRLPPVASQPWSQGGGRCSGPACCTLGPSFTPAGAPPLPGAPRALTVLLRGHDSARNNLSPYGGVGNGAAPALGGLSGMRLVVHGAGGGGSGGGGGASALQALAFATTIQEVRRVRPAMGGPWCCSVATMSRRRCGASYFARSSHTFNRLSCAIMWLKRPPLPVVPLGQAAHSGEWAPVCMVAAHAVGCGHSILWSSVMVMLQCVPRQWGEWQQHVFGPSNRVLWTLV